MRTAMGRPSRNRKSWRGRQSATAWPTCAGAWCATGFDSGSTLDYIYRDEARGKGPLGRMVDRNYLDAIGWRGIRVRGQHLQELLRDAAQRLRGQGTPVRVLDVAAGHGRYVLEALGQGEQRADRIVLRDFSDLNVTQGQALIERLGAADIARFEQGDAFDPAQLARVDPAPTLAVVSGLYELFPDNDAVLRSLQGIAATVPVGGYLAYTGQPWHPQLEFIARALTSHRGGAAWVMRRRTQQEMDELVRLAGFEKVAQRIDDFGIFTVGAPLAARPVVAGPVGPVLLRQLRLRQLDGQPPCCAAGDGVRLGDTHSVRAVDDRAVLVDRSVLCDLVLPVPATAGTGPARAAAVQRAGYRGGVFPAVAVAFQLRTAGDRRCVRLAVRCAAGLRQAVQPGAVAAHRAADRAVGEVRAVPARRLALGAAWVGAADRRFGTDHVPAPFHRHPDRPAGGMAMRLAVAGAGHAAAARLAHRTRPQALAHGAVLSAGGGGPAGAGGAAARCSAVAAVAGGVAAAGGTGLRRAGHGGVPEARRWTPDDGGTLAAGAVSGCGLDQLTSVDTPCATAGAGDGRRVVGAHSQHRVAAAAAGRGGRLCRIVLPCAGRGVCPRADAGPGGTHAGAAARGGRGDRAAACAGAAARVLCAGLFA
ncbi:hypothetical protein G6F31_011674 [Rhizopus arrhizus]|nr:hypothetical protein G6F31_011674 [Rhizopus arrhizus]